MIVTLDGKDFAQFPIRALKPEEAQAPARIELKAHGRPKKTSSEMPDENPDPNGTNLSHVWDDLLV